MYTPRPQAPPAFMKRYDAIMKGKERLDTVDKLKDFWLFAIAQGWESYEGREWVAGLTQAATTMSPLLSFVRKLPANDPLHYAYLEFCTWEYIGESPRPQETDEQYADKVWAFTADIVNSIEPDKYTSKVKRAVFKDMLRSHFSRKRRG